MILVPLSWSTIKRGYPVTCQCENKNDGFEGCTVSALPAIHDNQMLDVIVTCNECGRKFNTFLSFGEMIQQETSCQGWIELK